LWQFACQCQFHPLQLVLGVEFAVEIETIAAHDTLLGCHWPHLSNMHYSVKIAEIVSGGRHPARGIIDRLPFALVANIRVVVDQQQFHRFGLSSHLKHHAGAPVLHTVQARPLRNVAQHPKRIVLLALTDIGGYSARDHGLLHISIDMHAGLFPGELKRLTDGFGWCHWLAAVQGQH